MRKFTYFDVVSAMRRKEIHRQTLKLSQSPSGSKSYLRCYSRARCQVEQKLSESKRQKYRAMAKAWSEKKLPPKVQRRYVHGNNSRVLELTYFSTSMMAKRGPKAIKEFTSSAYKQFGMRVVVLASFLDDGGRPAITL